MFVNNAITGSSELTDKSNPKFISIEELTKFGPIISVIKFNQDLVIEPPNNTKINNIRHSVLHKNNNYLSKYDRRKILDTSTVHTSIWIPYVVKFLNF